MLEQNDENELDAFKLTSQLLHVIHTKSPFTFF